MDPTDSNADLELIAALLDGRLSGEEKVRAMKLLADSDDARELFASSLRTVQDVGVGGSTPDVKQDVKVVPIGAARRRSQWKVFVPLAAAAVLTIVVVPKLVNRGSQTDSANAYATMLTQNPRFAGELHTGWEQRWAVTRGGEPTSQAPGTQAAGSPAESRLAFRLGVRSVDLQVALSRGDTALAQRVTNEILETLKGVAFSELVGARYTELQQKISTDARAQLIERASGDEGELRNLLGSSLVAPFAFGEWTGAAELAAETHDASFFESNHGASSIKSTGGLSSEDVEALGAIETRVKQRLTDSSLDEVKDVLQSVIRRRGG
ncbi:MAG TPA: hypothetical protein VK636_13135 [Gemmatimonadaceae bacterium]|nr:hypothetical protein [Gemmatimonadaceae bacterium]